MSGLNREMSIFKQEKADYYSLQLTLDNKFNSNCSISEQKADSGCPRRANWDLNVDMGMWDSSTEGLNTQAPHGMLDVGVMHEEKKEGLKETYEKSVICVPREIYYNPRFSGVTMPPSRCNADVGIDLELKLPCGPEMHFNWGSSSDELSSVIEMTNLNLSLACGGSMKCEQCDGGYQKVPRKLEFNNSKSVDHTQAESEPCGVLLEDASAGFHNFYRSNSGEMECDPYKGASQDQLNALEEKSSLVKADKDDITLYTTEVPKDGNGRMTLYFNCAPVNDEMKMHITSNIQMNAGKITPKLEDIVSLPLIPIVGKSHHSGELATGPSIPHNADELINKTSALVTANELENKTSALITVSLTSKGQLPSFPTEERSCGLDGHSTKNDIEPKLADGVPETISQTYSSIKVDSILSKCIENDQHHADSYRTNMLAESDHEAIDMSIDSLDHESYGSNHECGNSADIVSCRNMELSGAYNDCKEVEALGIGVHEAVVGPVEEGEEKHVVTKIFVKAMHPVNNPNGDEFERQSEKSNGPKKAVGSKGDCGGFCNGRNDPRIHLPSNSHGSDNARVPTSSYNFGISRKTRNHFIDKEKCDHSVKDIGERHIQRTKPKGGQREFGRKLCNAMESDLLPSKHIDKYKMGYYSFGDTVKYEDDRDVYSGKSKLNYASNRLPPQERNGAIVRSSVQHYERNKLHDGPFKRKKSYLTGRRYESCDYGFKESEHWTSHCNSNGERGSDLRLATRAEKREGGNTNEVAFAVASKYQFGEPGMVMPKPSTHEEHIHHVSSKNQKTEKAEVNIEAGACGTDNPGRDTGSSQCTERVTPDFHTTREGSFTRDFPHIMVDSSMLQHSGRHYERAVNAHIRRKRTHSPIQRGPQKVDLHVKCSEIFQTRSPSQRLYSEGSLDGFDGHPKSRQYSRTTKSDRMRSPPRLSCSAGDSMVQKGGYTFDKFMFTSGEGSLPPNNHDLTTHEYFHRKSWTEEECDRTLTNHRSSELKASVPYIDNRSLGRRRSDCVNEQSLVQLPDKHQYVKDNAVVHRHDFPSWPEEEHDRTTNAEIGWDERYKMVHSLGQNQDDSDKEGNLTYHDKNACKFLNKWDEEPSERDYPRGTDRYIRNRHWNGQARQDRSIKSQPLNNPRRTMGMPEQEENYRHHRKKSWHGAEPNKKRSRFNPRPRGTSKYQPSREQYSRGRFSHMCLQHDLRRDIAGTRDNQGFQDARHPP